ncbi:Rab-like_protein [Hexamita inflata]|uniref:Rab-like protein n=1 Tax=Hexamita inflata TaxID=28002 RepID=A0AA86TQM0_9EUKA|nr:Rab-like protein [Hexamita inflata]
MNKSTEQCAKLLIIGDESSGKSYLGALISGSQYKYQQTIGLDISTLELQNYLQCDKINGKLISGMLQILDTPGADTFSYSYYYKNTQIVLMLFKFSDKQSFTSCQIYAQRIKQCCQASYVILIGNAYGSSKPVVSIDEAVNFAQFNGFQFFDWRHNNFNQLQTHIQNVILKLIQD